MLIPIVAIAVTIAVVGVVAYYAGYFQSAPPSGGSSLLQATCSSVANDPPPVNVTSGGHGSHAYFLVVEADPPSQFAGLNGSANYPATQKWPVMQVTQNQTVSIHVINCASSEPHGFQISFYDPESHSLNVVEPGGSYDITFTATKVGTFRVYCSVFCSIHPLMQNGELVVTG